MTKVLTRLLALLMLLSVNLSVIAQSKRSRTIDLYQQAESAYNNSNYFKALTLLDQCLQLDPGFYDGYSLRGSVKEFLKDYDGALTDYSIFLEEFPDNGDVLLSRALVRYRLKFYEFAKEDMLALLKLPATTETNTIYYRMNMSLEDKKPVMTMDGQHKQHQSYLLNYLGLIEAKLKNYQAAKIYFDSAIQIEPAEADYFVNRGLMKEMLNDSSAIKDYQHAIQLHPNHTLAKHNYKLHTSKTTITESVEQRLSETIQSDPSLLYPYLERAQERFTNGNYQGAIEDYSLALELERDNVEIWLGRGLAKERMNDLKGAFSDYTQAIDRKNNYAKAWLNRGNVLLKMERYEDAIEDYSIALLYYPDFSTAFYNRAMAKGRLKQKEEACKDLMKAESLGMKIDAKIKANLCPIPPQ